MVLFVAFLVFIKLFGIWWCLSGILLNNNIICVQAQISSSQQSFALDSISTGLDAFSIELLTKTSVEGGNGLNVIISTFSIWNLLTILNEGASGTTANQLQSALRIPSDKNVFRLGYSAIDSSLTAKSNGIELNIANAIFVNKKKQLLDEYRSRLMNQYRINLIPIDFQDRQRTAQYIDSYIANATGNRLRHFINFDDLVNAELLLTNAIFFKGQWTLQFNRSETHREPFYDENMNELGQVNMMHRTGPFAYTMLDNLQGHAVELPYGQDEKFAMIILLPKKSIPLLNFLNNLTSIPFHSITDALDQAKTTFYDDDVDVFLPRFSVTSDFVLNVILEQMGILDVFDPYYANLRQMSNENFYLSRVIHKAEIEVTEEGTVASGASAGSISYKQPPPKFRANRPFVYFIIEKSSRAILFAGKITNPNNL